MKSFMRFKVASTDRVLIIVCHRVPHHDYTFKWRRFNTAKLSVYCNEASRRRHDIRRRWTSGANRNALGPHNRKISKWAHRRFYYTSPLLFSLKILRDLWRVLSSYVDCISVQLQYITPINIQLHCFDWYRATSAQRLGACTVNDLLHSINDRTGAIP